MAGGWGGSRRGAGRKKKTVTLVRELVLSEADKDAQYALGLLVQYLRDEDQDDKFRYACATEVMDRVWGKPTQRQEGEVKHSGEVILRWADGVPVPDVTPKPESDLG